MRHYMEWWKRSYMIEDDDGNVYQRNKSFITQWLSYSLDSTDDVFDKHIPPVEIETRNKPSTSVPCNNTRSGRTSKPPQKLHYI